MSSCIKCIYPWAGEIRSVTIAKARVYGLPQHIELYAAGVFDHLHRENLLRELPREQFIDRLTDYYAEVYAVHPFREGNTRTTRTFFGQLARDAGYDIQWSRLDYESGLEANFASLDGDYSKLHSVLDDLVEERRCPTKPTTE